MLPSAASASSLDAAGTKIVAFADSRSIPFPASLSSQLMLMRETECARAESPRTVSAAAALKVAAKLVAQDSHGRGMRAIAASPATRTESGAIAAAAGALGGGKPAAALGALLRAHQLAPGDPVPLIDAASLLNEAGRGNEALAFLGAASKLRLPKTDPFGIGWKAVEDANRGQALLLTGRLKPAEAPLNAALKQAPLLTEADHDLALAYDCQNRTAAAQRFLVAGVARQQFSRGDYIEKSRTDPFGQLNPAEVLDSSRGQTLELETFRFPTSLGDGAGMFSAFVNLSNAQISAITASQSQLSHDQTALYQKLQSESPATRQRTQDIESAIQDSLLEPDIKQLQDRAEKVQGEIGTLQSHVEGQGGCMDGGASYGQWASLLAAWDQDWRSYMVADYRRETALASNLRDPLAHQVGLDIAHNNVAFDFATLINGGWIVAAGYDHICYQGQPAQENPESGQRQEPPGPPCPTGINAPNFSINLLILSFSVTCEEVTIEGEAGEGFLNAFISVSHNFRTGSTTVYGGPQVGAKVDVGPFSGGATARGGVYVTFGSDGSVQDVGVRGETATSVSVGRGTASISGPQASVSFVSSPAM